MFIFIIFSILIIILALVISLIFYAVLLKLKFRNLDILPGPPTKPLVGNVLEFGDNPVDSFKAIVRLTKEYGPACRIKLGLYKYAVFVTDPDLVELILSSPKYLKKGAGYKYFKPWLGNGLLLSTGAYWKSRRRIITPTFHFKILEQFLTVFNSNGDLLLKKLEEQIDKDSFDIYPLITAFTLDVICESAMGTTVNAQNDPNNEYVNAVRTMCHIVLERHFSVWKQFDALFKLHSTYQEQKKALDIIHGFTDSVIQERKNQLLKSLKDDSRSKVGDEDEFGMKKRKVAFLDLLLQSTVDGKPLSDADIREEVDTFMFEGHDTTASAVCFALYELARNPDVQIKIVEELKEINEVKEHEQWTIQDLNNMKYLDLVVKETLRMYPSVPYYARTLEEEVTYNGTTFPKGTIVNIIVYALQRRSDLFKNPDKFEPERFLSEDMKNKHPYMFVPFSAGPRNCIGQKFAMYELKATIGKVVQNFEIFNSNSEIILSGEAILKSANGFFLKFKRRT